MTRLADRVVVITGGAGGVGRACAEQVVQQGGRAVIADLDEARGREAAAALGEATLFVRLDVASEADWAALMAQVQVRFGGLHGLVNAAAIFPSEHLEATSLALWQRVMRLNADGVFLGCQAAVKAMRSSASGTRGGSIVNIASTAGLAGHQGMCAYSASKGAMLALTRNVAAHCRSQGLFIRCNAVIPGGIKTPMTTGLWQALPPEVTDITVSPTAGFCEPVDVAHAVTYLLGDESRFVNGSELRVDNALLTAIA